MGNYKSGFDVPPKEYLRDLRRETNTHARSMAIAQKRHSGIRVPKREALQTENQERELSEKAIDRFLISNPDFLDNYVKTYASKERIRAWLKMSASAKSESNDKTESDKKEALATEIVERNFRQRQAMVMIRNHLFNPFRHSQEEFRSLIARPKTKSEIPEINSHLFPYVNINVGDINRIFIDMITQLLGKHGFPMTELCYFLSTLKANYFDVEYHNYNHALSHAQSMFWILKNNPGVFTENEMKALMIASIAHDVGHFGVNEKYLKEMGTGLERMYHSPILEHHHIQICFLILADIKCNVFTDLDSNDYKMVLRCIRHAIRSTDVVQYKTQVQTMRELLSHDLDFEDTKVKYAVISIMMMACDLCSAWKRWPEHKISVWGLYKEFFDQGGMEMQRGIDSPPQMMRMHFEKIPEYQLAFLKNIVLPIFELVVKIFPNCKSILKETKENRDLWETFSE